MKMLYIFYIHIHIYIWFSSLYVICTKLLSTVKNKNCDQVISNRSVFTHQEFSGELGIFRYTAFGSCNFFLLLTNAFHCDCSYSFLQVCLHYYWWKCSSLSFAQVCHRKRGLPIPIKHCLILWRIFRFEWKQ